MIDTLLPQNQNNAFENVVADNISAMLAYWDSGLVCRFANAAYQEWFGKSRGEMVNRITMQQLLGPLFNENLPYITGVLEGTAQTFERTIALPNGEIRYSLANYFPDIADGEVKGFFVHVADVTPVKQLERDLSFTHELVAEQNTRLLNFANTVSHNFKSYSANLETMIELLDAASSEQERVKMISYLKKISKGFSQTVHDLNEIAKAQNLSTATPEKINLHEFINKSIEILRVQITITNASILNLVNPTTTIYANPAYMESILLNLLTNAIKYRHPERTPHIEVFAAMVEGELALTVKDNGLGIDMKKFGGELFGLYKTFHKNSDANGVGLYIVKFQVEAMGARITLNSTLGKGTAFSVYFKV